MPCIICDNDITDGNDSNEHIILSSIGGRKQVRKFICKSCNGKTGSSWDSKLEKELHPLSVLSNIKRDRKKLGPMKIETETGKSALYYPDGSIEKDRVYVDRIGDEVSVSIPFPINENAKKQIKGLKRKYPHFNIDEAILKADINEEFPGMSKIPQISFGGEHIFKSIVKSILATVFDAGIDPSVCDIALSFLRGERGNMPIGLFYEHDFIQNRLENVQLHCICVKGCPDTKKIFAYVEFYELYRIISLVSSDYKGEKFEHYYAINPTLGEELKLDIDFDRILDKISELYFQKLYEGIKKCIEYYFDAFGVSFDNENLRKILEEAYKECGIQAGEIPNDEQLEYISSITLNKLEALIAKQDS